VRLLLAGLLVFLGVALAVSAFEAFDAFETWPKLVIGPLFLGVCVGLFALTFRLLGGKDRGVATRERIAAARQERERTETLRPRAGLDFRFSFVSTHRDLLDAHQAMRREVGGMRPWVRGLVILMGIAWLVGFGFSLAPGFEGDGPVWIWGILGSAVLWFFVWRPASTRRAIRHSNEAEVAVTVRFDRRCVESTVRGIRTGRRWWREVGLFVPAPGGVALAFEDGAIQWLPRRVFADDRERERFVEEVEARLAQEAVRFERPMGGSRLVDRPWTWTIVDFRHGGGADGSDPFVDLSLRRGAEVRRLRFLDPVDVLFRAEGRPQRQCGLVILDVPYPELDGLGVRVTDREGEIGVVELWAREVVDLDAARRAASA